MGRKESNQSKATHTNKQPHSKLQVVYVSIYIALCLTHRQLSVSLKVLDGKIIRHKILRMLKFHPITAFMTTYSNFKQYFELGFLGLNIFLQFYLSLAF